MQEICAHSRSAQTPGELHVVQAILKSSLKTKILCCQAGVCNFFVQQYSDKQVQNPWPGSLIKHKNKHSTRHYKKR